MSNTLLLINADGPETRVALVEDGLLGELYIERKQERGIAGNIYKGRVERVLPGMQAAFVNIGLEKSAYLHVSDVRGTPDDLKRLTSSGESSTREHGEDDEPETPSGGARIEDLLKEGQEIVVQVTKEPISTKGAVNPPHSPPVLPIPPGSPAVSMTGHRSDEPEASSSVFITVGAQ